MCTISEKKRSLIKQMTVLCEDVVKSYMTDLTAYDIPSIICKPDGTKFLWASRTCGTQILWVDNLDEQDIEYNITIVKHYDNDHSGICWHYYNGEVLRPVTAKEILTGKFWKV